MIRLPDFYSKIHGAGVIDGLGIISTFLGLTILQDCWASVFKLQFVALIILYISPISSFALAKSALDQKVKKESIDLN